MAAAAPQGWPAAALKQCAPAGSSCAAAAVGLRPRLQQEQCGAFVTACLRAYIGRAAEHSQANRGALPAGAD